jgi:polyhydroxyalkanoate synthesis repressor PhaR
MHTIKKYANRKLYHTNEKQYITLDGIAKLVQRGEAVQVLDNETGDDITSSILAQVVLQARGRSGPQLPTTLLTGMIQLGGDTLASVRKTLFSSLGGIDVIDAEIGRRIDLLVDQGKLTPDESLHWRQLLLHQDVSHAEGADFPATDAAVPDRNDVVRLHAQVDDLAAIVEQLLRTKKPD